MRTTTISSRSMSMSSTPISVRHASSLEKCFSDLEFRKQHQYQYSTNGSITTGMEATVGSNDRCSDHSTSFSCEPGLSSELEPQCIRLEVDAPIPGSHKIITNRAFSRGCDIDECDGPNTSGKDIMAPVLGVPPPPPPAPHMGPDGLILPRKPYNPCLTSTNHKDLHRELLFNQKIGKKVLNQKSELQRALEKHREMVSRKEAERNQEELFKNDPRTALQRALEQRAKHIKLSQQPQPSEPPNPLVTARANLRRRIDSQ